EAEGHTVECDKWIYPDKPCNCNPASTTTPTTAAVDRSYADGYNNGFRHGKQSRQPIDYLPAQQPEVETPRIRNSIEKYTSTIQADVDWINHLGARFPTHRSVEKFKALLQTIAGASVYDPGETEQPVTVKGLTLGDVRMARRLLR